MVAPRVKRLAGRAPVSTAAAGGPRRPPHRRLDRLSPLDVSNLRVERFGGPMNVAGLAILDGACLYDATGQLRLDTVRAEVQRRLHLVPRLRQVLCEPRHGLGPPIWADDARFDIRQHVRSRPVPAPGDRAALLAVCAELNRPPLDRSRPLWELWLLPGLTDGGVGLLIRLHHVVADGIAAVAMIGGLLGADPDVPIPAAPPWQPVPAPTAWDTYTDMARRQGAAMAKAAAKLRHPAVVLHRLGSRVREMRMFAGEGLAPRVSWNRPTGTRRQMMLARADLARTKAVAHMHGATVNDVVLAAVAGGARRLLLTRGELRPGMTLKASVAVSTRDPADRAATGNLVGIMLAPLPVSEPSPARRVAMIATATRQRKRYPPYQPAGRVAQRWMVRAMSHQRLINMFTSNLPGPPVRMYFAGARVAEVFQAGVVQGNVTVAVGVLSYAGQLNFTIVGDADAVPDLAVFADGLSDALAGLGATPGDAGVT